MNHFKIIAITAAFAATASAASIPSDCNNNGIDDATDIANGTSQDCNGNGIPDECELGSGTGGLIGQLKLPDSGTGFSYTIEVGDNLGGAIELLGDLDGDRVADIAVGAPDDDDGGENAGAVYILFMNSDGTIKATQKISATSGGFTGGLNVGDDFGASLAAVGDLDGDGDPELLVGAPDDDEAGDNAGACWLLSLASDGTVTNQIKYTTGSGGFTNMLDVGDNFGWSVEAVGDLDGDRTVDLAVGAPDDDDGEKNAGAVWVLFLNPDGSVKAESKISSSGGGLGGSLDVGDHFGSSLTLLGDIGGDGSPEIVVGSPNDDDGGENTGAVYVLSLNAGGQVVAEQKISALSGGFGGALDIGDHFGSAVASMGDHDGDGVADVAVGSPGDDDGGENAGALYVLLLDAGGLSQADTKIATGSGGFTGVLGIGGDFGHSIANVGDRNGDGFADLATGTPDDDDAGNNAGALWLLLFDSVQNDCDGNGVPDVCDVDCNGNGQPDACDIANDPTIDCNGNSIPDSCDIASGFSTDCDGNQRPDECDIDDDPSLDCDGNGQIDFCEYGADPLLDCDTNGVLDKCEIASDPALDWNGDDVLDVCSSPNYCTANPNSTGQIAAISVSGSPVITDNNFTLTSSQMPTFEFGYFLMAETQGFIPDVGGSSGNLCLGFPFYRFNTPPTGTSLSSGSNGAYSFTPNLTNLPQNVVFIIGATWDFQAWYRDGAAGTSNFTDGIEVMFR